MTTEKNKMSPLNTEEAKPSGRLDPGPVEKLSAIFHLFINNWDFAPVYKLQELIETQTQSWLNPLSHTS